MLVKPYKCTWCHKPLYWEEIRILEEKHFCEHCYKVALRTEKDDA